MNVVRLGDDVATVRRKVGMEENDYRQAWLSLNTKAREICQSLYGDVSLKGIGTLSGISSLKDHYAQARGTEGQMERQKILAALQVSGASAWIIHNAVKRNFDKYQKDSRAKGAGPSSTKNVTARTEPFDPIRHIE